MPPTDHHPLQVARWFNAPDDFSIDALKGRVIVMLAFQMLCPGCVSTALPQMQKVRMTFREDDVAVIGLHTVFEHHEAQSPVSLAAFLHENRIAFPVGVDLPSDRGPLPQTMAAWNLRGTPTLLFFDRSGQPVGSHFGHIPDMALGAQLMSLLGR